MTEKTHLQRAYEVKTLEESGQLYDDWAETYDAEVAGNGYVTPQRCADALAAFSPDRDKPILDLGCGTGRAARNLSMAGYRTIDGADYSEGMLTVARKTALYRSLAQCDLNQPLADQLPPEKGFDAVYAHAVAVGVLQPTYVGGHALAAILERLAPGGVLVFSLNDKSLETGVFQQAMAELTASGRAETLFDVYGEHIPAIGLNARVYALKRTA